MHMADALLSSTVGATFWAGSLAAIGLAARKLREMIDDRMIPLMGVLGAFIFAAQMINFTIPGTGSSGHLGGGMVLAILLGPSAAFLVVASVLTVQSLFFADGGLLALGCNIWNLGLYPCFISFPMIYRPIAGDGARTGRIAVAAVLSSVAGLQLGSISVVLQTVLSGKSELPFGTFALVMQPIHLAIGLIEGVATAGVVGYVRTVRPELLAGSGGSGSRAAGAPLRSLLVPFVLLTVLTAGALSWFASSRPDGLEWSVEKVAGTAELSSQEGRAAGFVERLQKRMAVMPEYGFRQAAGDLPVKGGNVSWPGIEPGTSLAGLLGAAIVFSLVIAAGIGIRIIRRRNP